MSDPYAVLGVNQDAEPEVIEAAYRALMKKYHPDRVSGTDAQQRAREINAAYDLLKDPVRRAAFDASCEPNTANDHKRWEHSEPREAALQIGRPPHWLRSAAFTALGGLLVLVLVLAWPRPKPETVAAATTDEVAPVPPPIPAIAPVEPPSQTIQNDRTLTTEGLGPIRIDMSRAEIEAAVGPLGLHHESGECAVLFPATTESMELLLESDRLTRVSTTNPSIRTPRGIGIGSTTEEVRTAYGPTLMEDPHVYADPPAQYLTYLVPKSQGGLPGEGVRFETDPKGIVVAIHGGRGSLGYVEGCL